VLSHLRRFGSLRGWSVEDLRNPKPRRSGCQSSTRSETRPQAHVCSWRRWHVHLLLNAVAAYAGLVLGVIPAGGGNDLAVALLLEGEPRELDIVRVRTSDGNERLYAGGGGVGLDSEAVRHANGAYRSLPGRSRYVLSAVRAPFGFRAIQVRITVGANEWQPLEASALLVGVPNTPSYGGGLYLAPSAKIDDGNLDVILLEDLSLGQILKLLPALGFRGELKTPRLHPFSTPHVRIETDPPCWVHGDGELLGLTPVDVAIVRKAVRVLCPDRNPRG
jgi:diacylglycerol kinase (ATP)